MRLGFLVPEALDLDMATEDMTAFLRLIVSPAPREKLTPREPATGREEFLFFWGGRPHVFDGAQVFFWLLLGGGAEKADACRVFVVFPP